MKAECDNYPQFNHDICALDPFEKVIGDYFEYQNLSVKRLCSEWLPEGERSPDFRITDTNNLTILCEVKSLSSSTAAMTQTDWEYTNHAEFEYLLNEAKKLDTTLVARSDQLKLWKGEIPYPQEGRNTEQEEKKYEKYLNDRLRNSEAANLRFEITIHRRDSLIWTQLEKEEFIDNLAENLLSIKKGVIPRGWHQNLGVVYGRYTKKREHGYRVQNSIEIRESSASLTLKSYSYLGVNWKSIERVCHHAQRQIRDRLRRETMPNFVARLIIVILTIDLVSMYFSEQNELINEVKRRLFDKLPDISAIAFCETSEIVKDGTVSLGQFFVFHSGNKDVPILPTPIFMDNLSIQLQL